jgi:hypothetical protein
MGSLLKNSLAALAFGCALTANAQETDSTWRVMDFPRSSTYFGLEVGADLSYNSRIRFGYSAATQFAGCAGWGAGGHALGVSFRPESNACGMYAQVWATVFVLNVGLQAGYETDLRDNWATLQPQVGLGVGLFRLSYNYSIPFGLSDRSVVPRHNLGIAYTFPMTEL